MLSQGYNTLTLLTFYQILHIHVVDLHQDYIDCHGLRITKPTPSWLTNSEIKEQF